MTTAVPSWRVYANEGDAYEADSGWRYARGYVAYETGWYSFGPTLATSRDVLLAVMAATDSDTSGDFIVADDDGSVSWTTADDPTFSSELVAAGSDVATLPGWVWSEVSRSECDVVYGDVALTFADTVTVLVEVDVPASMATDPRDLLESVSARVRDEAGYLETGEAVVPVAVRVRLAD